MGNTVRHRILCAGYTDETKSERVILDSRTGIIYPPSRLPELLLGERGYIAGHDVYSLAADCHKTFSEYDEWVFRCTSRKRTKIRDGRSTVIGHFLPLFCGFRDPNRNLPPKYFHFLDLYELTGKRVGETVAEVLEAAGHFLDMADRRGVKWNASRGALAGRLLKASPEWEDGRHAAPAFINDIGREAMPGNYYGLGASTGKTYPRALYLDQSAAHHAIAASTPVPHPHYLRARGHTRLLEAGKPRPWAKTPEAISAVFEQYGMVAAMVTIPPMPQSRHHLYPPIFHTPGRRIEYLFTNELHYFDGNKGILEYLVGAWTSPLPDPAVKEYAGWALEEIARGESSKAKKPLLLSAYGMLAMRSDNLSISYYAKGRGEPVRLPRAGLMREVRHSRRPNQPQPSIINTLARGMIESETRKRSLLLAHELDRMGIPILSVYVDGLIVQTDAVPFLPSGWRVAKALTHVRFLHPNSFTSMEVEKLPGIPKDLENRRYAARSALAGKKRAKNIS